MTKTRVSTQTRCGLMQGNVLINTIICILEMYVHFKFVGEDADYIHSKLHNVAYT